MKHNRAHISKSIGWTKRSIKIPTRIRVEFEYLQALNGDFASACKLLEWYRFCKRPTSQAEIDIINRIAVVIKEVME